jgi:hypothetical protein
MRPPPPGRPRKKGAAAKPKKRIVMGGLNPSPESSYGPQIELGSSLIPGLGPKKPKITCRSPARPNNEIQYI